MVSPNIKSRKLQKQQPLQQENISENNCKKLKKLLPTLQNLRYSSLGRAIIDQLKEKTQIEYEQISHHIDDNKERFFEYKKQLSKTKSQKFFEFQLKAKDYPFELQKSKTNKNDPYLKQWCKVNVIYVCIYLQKIVCIGILSPSTIYISIYNILSVGYIKTNN